MLTALLLALSLQLSLSPAGVLLPAGPGSFTFTFTAPPGSWLAHPQGTTLVATASSSRPGTHHASLLFPLPSKQLPAILSCIFHVNDSSSSASDYPSSLKSSSEPDAIQYQQKPDYYALRYDDPKAQPDGAIAIIREGNGTIAIFRGQPSSNALKNRSHAATPLPVYGLPPSPQTPVSRQSGEQTSHSSKLGPAVVPTGEVFIRFSANINARDRAAQLRKAGYEITRVLDFAPQGAWVRARSGSTAESLQRLSELEGLAGMETVEPQMLMERRSR